MDARTSNPRDRGASQRPFKRPPSPVVSESCVEGVYLRIWSPIVHPSSFGKLNPQKWHFSASSRTLSAQSGHRFVAKTLMTGLSSRSFSCRMPSMARAKQYGNATNATATAAPAACCGALVLSAKPLNNVSVPAATPIIVNHQRTFICFLRRWFAWLHCSATHQLATAGGRLMEWQKRLCCAGFGDGLRISIQDSGYGNPLGAQE